MKTTLTRRKFLQIVAVAGAATGAWQLGLLNGRNELQVARRSQPIMGTYLNLTIYGKDRDECENGVNATIAKMVALEEKLSRHMENSQVFQLNTRGTLSAPSNELVEVLQRSAELSRKTEGAFDISVLPLLSLHSSIKGHNNSVDAATLTAARNRTGYEKVHVTNDQVYFDGEDMGITLDGIGKGYIVDQGVQVLRQNGFNNVYVDAGGDLMVTGSKKDGSPWRIGIMSPREGDSSEPVVIKVTDKAVATSGDYFQYFTNDKRHHHILDPRTGFSSPELASCTITAPDVVTADGLATAVMVLGKDNGLALLESMNDCEGYLIDKQQNRYHTSNFFS